MISPIVNFIKKFFNNRASQKEIFADFHTTLTKVDNNFVSLKSVILDEKLVGNIYSLKEVRLTPNAEFLGNIYSKTSNISGKITGNIISYDSATINESAILFGNITTKSIIIEHGSNINGLISIDEKISEYELLDKVEKQLHQKSNKEINNNTYQIFKPNQQGKGLVHETSSPIDISGKLNEKVPLSVSDNQRELTIKDQGGNIKPNLNSWY